MGIDKNRFLEKIKDFLSEDDSNKMTKLDGSLIFNPEVSVGFVSGNDPLFEDYKKIIGSFHLSPRDVYNWFCEKNSISPSPLEEISVVTFILPITPETKKQNLEYSKEPPGERWAHTRLFGEKANERLQAYLVDELKKEGINAIAPILEKELFKMLPKHENGVWASTWSHRHMAFAAGLGSFGLSDGFINEKGIAMRCGSIIVDYKLPTDADKRPSDPYAYCIDCGKCIDRCPVGAITLKTRHDKAKCSLHCLKTTRYIKKNYQINIYACGLCQVGVPCENGIPIKDSEKS
ncbi:MAG: 4Fe-4S binding protein [Candidatus Helarchaeota archaeon]|nr:4Fe-4S binding protein [Candidatus Helarchaeota archaeon]